MSSHAVSVHLARAPRARPSRSPPGWDPARFARRHAVFVRLARARARQSTALASTPGPARASGDGTRVFAPPLSVYPIPDKEWSAPGADGGGARGGAVGGCNRHPSRPLRRPSTPRPVRRNSTPRDERPKSRPSDAGGRSPASLRAETGRDVAARSPRSRPRAAPRSRASRGSASLRPRTHPGPAGIDPSPKTRHTG